MIGGIVLFLIFSPDLTNNSDLKSNTPSSEQPSNPNNNNQNNDNNNQNNNEETPKEEIFATKIQLNCSNSIILSVGTCAELLDGYIYIEPQQYINNLTTSIKVESGVADGISFANNKITALGVGRYVITFYVPKTQYVQIHETLSVRVVAAEDDNKVKLKKNNFVNNTTIHITEMLDINETYTDYFIPSTGNVTYVNNQITFNNEGNSTLQFNINTPYLTYKYNFDFLVKKQITASVVIEGENNGVLEIEKEVGKAFNLVYVIKDGSGEDISQLAKTTVETNDIVEIIDEISPTVIFLVLAKGSAIVTITPMDNEIPPRQILVIIK